MLAGNVQWELKNIHSVAVAVPGIDLVPINIFDDRLYTYEKVIKVDYCTFHWLFPSVYHLSGFYNDPPEGGSTHRGSGLTCAVIHRSGAVQRHPIGPGASAKLCSYQPLALIRFHDDSVNFLKNFASLFQRFFDVKKKFNRFTHKGA